MTVLSRIKPLMLAVSLSSCTYTEPEEQRTEKCSLAFPSEPVLAPYVEMLAENPKISQAAGLCGATNSFQQLFWDKLKLTEETGTAPDNPIPVSFHNLAPKEYFIDIAPAEAEQMQAAYLAHALWIDQSGMLPWKLADYQPEELNALFNPLNHFWEWKPAEEKYEIGYLLDHSPAMALSIAQETVDSTSLIDQKSTIIEFVRELRHFRHGNPGAKNSDGEVYCFDSEEIPTMEEMFETKVSTFGCKSMASYLCSLAIVYNIPCETTEGYYGGVGHRTALFKLTDQVLAHGDNIYEHYLLNTPSEQVLDDYQLWEDEILPYPYSGVDSAVAHKSRIHDMENGIAYPSHLLMRSYCRDGRKKLDDYFGEYIDKARLDLLEQQIKDTTQNCTEIPKDNPDGTGESYHHICTRPETERATPN